MPPSPRAEKPDKGKESERELRPDSAKERERFTVPAVASRFGRIKEKSQNANCVQTQSGGCGSWKYSLPEILFQFI